MAIPKNSPGELAAVLRDCIQAQNWGPVAEVAEALEEVQQRQNEPTAKASSAQESKHESKRSAHR